MITRKSPLSRARRRGQETRVASSVCVLLPLPSVNLPLAWRTINAMMYAFAAQGWRWCRAASHLMGRYAGDVKSALDAPQAGRWAQ